MLRLLYLFVFILLAACDDPTASREPPPLRSMMVFMILDPDTVLQHALVLTAGAEGRVAALDAELLRDGELVASGTRMEDLFRSELQPCIDRYGTLGWRGEADEGAGLHCTNFRIAPEFGGTYSLRITADDRPTATATTRVPGDFQVLAVSAAGDPPGTAGLSVRWTPSDGAYRYLVGLRPTVPPWCSNGKCGCSPDESFCRWVAPDRQGWFVATADTVLETAVSGKGADEIAGSEGPWFIEVYAVDRALYQYLTSGSTGNLFPVAPTQNVEGGHGAVGAWVRRSMKIEP